jgi:hypothetical protein
MSEPQILVAKLLAMRVCVPSDFTDEQIIAFAEKQNPAGTSNGWVIARKGATALAGSEERIQCAEKPDCVHMVLYV